jgi:dienelactone hydrolase
MLSVEYRYAPEHPGLTPVHDSYVALRWLADHSDELGVDPAGIAVMGDSAGGGIAAGLAVLARDRGGPPIAQRILFYPMLDDRTTVPDPALVPFAGWTYEDNLTGWGALLGGDVGGPDVSPYAAPARLDDCTNLPPTYIEVGELDIFRDECVEFARRTTHGTGGRVHRAPRPRGRSPRVGRRRAGGGRDQAFYGGPHPTASECLSLSPRESPFPGLRCHVRGRTALTPVKWQRRRWTTSPTGRPWSVVPLTQPVARRSGQ